MANVAAPWATFAIDATTKIKSPCPIPFVHAESNWVSIAGNDWCKPVMTISEYVPPKIPIPINPVVLYSQTIMSVIPLDNNNITGPITVKVKNPVIITDNNGVNVKSIDDGNFLWKNFSNIDNIQTAAKTGITW